MSDRDPDSTDAAESEASGDSADDIPFVDDEADEADATPFVDDDADEDPFAALGDAGEPDPFTEMDTDAESVGDDVFEMLGGEEEEEAPSDLNIERDPEVEEVDEGVVVPKRSYCERCPHFSEPPTVACTNPGTTIHELVDVKHFRVSNCPVVDEQQAGRAPGE